MTLPHVDYDAGLVDLAQGSFALTRGPGNQYIVIELPRRRVVGSVTVSTDGKVTWSSDVGDVVLAWMGHCAEHRLDPWP